MRCDARMREVGGMVQKSILQNEFWICVKKTVYLSIYLFVCLSRVLGKCRVRIFTVFYCILLYCTELDRLNRG